MLDGRRCPQLRTAGDISYSEIVNPFNATLINFSLTTAQNKSSRFVIARDFCCYVVFILLFAAVPGAWILPIFGISFEAFRIARGILLFSLDMEMVCTKKKSDQPASNGKYERMRMILRSCLLSFP